MEVLRCLYVPQGRVPCPQRQDGLPGLGKVWEPTPVIGDHRKVTRESLIEIENVFPLEGPQTDGTHRLGGMITDRQQSLLVLPIKTRVRDLLCGSWEFRYQT